MAIDPIGALARVFAFILALAITLGGLVSTLLGLVIVIGGVPVGIGLIMFGPFLLVVGLKLIGGVLEGDVAYGRGTWWVRR